MRETERTYNHNHKRKNKFAKFLAWLILIIIVSGGILSFADIGGYMLFNLAKNYLGENYNLSLYTDKITGNPFKGYRLNNFELHGDGGKKILSAENLLLSLRLSALIRGKINPSELAIEGANINLDSFSGSLGKFGDFPIRFIPADISIINSKLNSLAGVFDVKNLHVNFEKFDVNIDASLNGIPVNGIIDFSESSGFNAINRSDISIGSGKILATGGIFNNEALDLHASIQDLNLQEIAAIYPVLNESGGFDGTANFNIDITGYKDEPRISGSLDYVGRKFYGLFLERVSANLAYSDNVLTVNDLQASAFSVPIQGEMSITSRPNEKLFIAIKLDGSETNLDVPELKKLSGKIESFNADIRGCLDSLNGVINFSAPRIKYNDKTLANIKTQIKLSNSDTANVNGKFILEGAQGYLQGKIESFLLKPVLNLNAKIVDLDINRVADIFIENFDEYKLSGKITLLSEIKGSAGNPVLTGNLSSHEITSSGNKLMKPVINFVYSDNKLNLTRSEGTYNGMPARITGNITHFPSLNPELNINATALMTPSQLKNFIPGINKYSLKGNINAGARIQGTLNDPELNLLFYSQNLQALDGITARNIELIYNEHDTSINAKNLTLGGLTLSKIAAKIENDNGQINLSANSPAVILEGFNIGGFNAKISGTTENLNLDSVKAGEINLSGNMQVYPAIKLNLALNSKNFRLERVFKNLSGGADLDFTLNGTEKKITGKGAITANNLNFHGLKLTDINLPLNYSNGNLESNGTFKFYDGSAKNLFNLDFDTKKFTSNLEISGLNINKLIHDSIKNFTGQISSMGNLSLKINGDDKTCSGTGNFSANSGNITGFEWLDSINKSDGIKFSGIHAPLLLQSGKLIIKSGSSINPVKNEKLYKYAKLLHDGFIDFGGNELIMNLLTETSINAKIINMNDLLTRGAGNSGDFRPVMLSISGNIDSLNFSAGESSSRADSQKLTREQMRDEIKGRARDEIRKGLRLGLGGIFN